MSTCSTATSARRGHERQRRRRRAPPSCDAGDSEAVHGRLERRLVDLERDWDTYKTAHPGAPRHRRSRSATGTPSSAVTVAAPHGLLLPLLRCSSPRRLVSSLQRTGSADSDCAAAKIISGADSPTGSNEEGPSSVCSVEGRGYSVLASSSSCSCPCRCAVCCGYSASSAAAAAVAPAGKSNGGSWVAAGRGRAIWISAIALVVMGFVAMAILELRVDEGCAEFLVPT